jgi:hypothetical protein
LRRSKTDRRAALRATVCVAAARIETSPRAETGLDTLQRRAAIKSIAKTARTQLLDQRTIQQLVIMKIFVTFVKTFVIFVFLD